MSFFRPVIIFLIYVCNAHSSLHATTNSTNQQESRVGVSPKVNLFLMGFQKAGSTSIFYRFLEGDSRFLLAVPRKGEPKFFKKESHFFDVSEEHQQGVEHYNSRFPDNSMRGYTPYIVDATPNYMYNSQNALLKMRDAYGTDGFAKLKFLVTIRDPVARIVSWWNHFTKTPQHLEHDVVSKYSSLQEYLEEMMEDRALDLYRDDAVNTQETAMFRNALVLGMYGKWLEMLLEVGASALNIYVIVLESMNDNDVEREVFDFLELALPGSRVMASKKHWLNAKPHSEEISDSMRTKLEQWYKPANCELMSLLTSRGVIRTSWEQATARSGGWIPTRIECNGVMTGDKNPPLSTQNVKGDASDDRSSFSTPISKIKPKKKPFRSCIDTAYGRIDSKNNGCEWYETHRTECGKHDIKFGYSNFFAGHNCCACGGGTSHKFDTKTMKRLLELVPCVTVVTIDDADSPDMNDFFSRAETVGLDRSKIRFQQEIRDPEHSSRGVWNAHRHAWEWGAQNGCDAMLIFEDDAFFSPDVVTEKGLTNAARYLESRAAYDLLLLGYVTPKDHFEKFNYSWDLIRPRTHCVFEMPVFDSLHAYIVSYEAMDRNQHRTWYLPDGEAVWNMDREISKESILGRVNVVAVYPSISFQSFHSIKNGWGVDAELQERINRRKANPEGCRAFNSMSIRHAPGSYMCLTPGIPAASVFILGVQKCGTSSLHNWLVGHKDIVPAKPAGGEPEHFRKELHFFDSKVRVNRGIAFYNAHFVDPLPSRSARYIDATPNYFYNLKGTIPNMIKMYGRKRFRALKFLLIVKDPIERLVSWWNHFSKVKLHKGSVSHAVFSEYSSLNEYVTYASEFAIDNKGFEDSSCTQQDQCTNILSLGVYSKWLRLWIDSGASSSQFEIIFLSEFQNNHEAVSKRVLKFLGLRPDAWDFKANVTDMSNHRHHDETLTPHTRSILDRYYFEYNCDFAKVLDGFRFRKWADIETASSGWIPSRERCYQNQIPPIVPDTLASSRAAGSMGRGTDTELGDPASLDSWPTQQWVVFCGFCIAAYIALYAYRRLGPIETLWKKNIFAAYVYKWYLSKCEALPK